MRNLKFAGALVGILAVAGILMFVSPAVGPRTYAQTGGCPSTSYEAEGPRTVDPRTGSVGRPVCIDHTTGQWILRPRSLEIEGATEDAFETTVSFTEPTADRTITFPNASVTVNGATFTDCMTGGATCTPTTVSSTVRVIYGTSGALNGASPSVAAVTLSPAFTASTSYICTATPNGATAAIAAGGVAVAYTSASVVTFTAANAATHTISYTCTGT